MMNGRNRALVLLALWAPVLLAAQKMQGGVGEHTFHVVRVLSLDDGSILSMFVQDDNIHPFSVGERSYGLQATRPQGEEQLYAMKLFRVNRDDGQTRPLTTMYSAPDGDTTFVRLGFTVTMMPVQAHDVKEVQEFIHRVRELDSLEEPGR